MKKRADCKEFLRETLIDVSREYFFHLAINSPIEKINAVESKLNLARYIVRGLFCEDDQSIPDDIIADAIIVGSRTVP